MAKIIAFVGAGGKTSAIYAYANELVSKGKKVVITTTTHMQFPNKEFLPLCKTANDVSKRFAQNSLIQKKLPVVLATDAGSDSGTHKICMPNPAELNDCYALCDFLLVEADGAKRLPLKVPATHEPVIPNDCDLIVICAGLDSLNHQIADVCFRQNEVCNILSSRLKNAVTPSYVLTSKDIAFILFDGYILPLSKNNLAKEFCVLLNKSDVLLSLEDANQVAKHLNNLCEELKIKNPTFNWNGVFISSIKNNSFEKFENQ